MTLKFARLDPDATLPKRSHPSDAGVDDNVYQLNLPATSVFGDADGQKMPLQAYGRYLKAHNTHVISVVTEMSTSSGPWCASSVMSKRSVVTRDMSLPVRTLSKKLNESS